MAENIPFALDDAFFEEVYAANGNGSSVIGISSLGDLAADESKYMYLPNKDKFKRSTQSDIKEESKNITVDSIKKPEMTKLIKHMIHANLAFIQDKSIDRNLRAIALAILVQGTIGGLIVNRPKSNYRHTTLSFDETWLDDEEVKDVMSLYKSMSEPATSFIQLSTHMFKMQNHHFQSNDKTVISMVKKIFQMCNRPELQAAIFIDDDSLSLSDQFYSSIYLACKVFDDIAMWNVVCKDSPQLQGTIKDDNKFLLWENSNKKGVLITTFLINPLFEIRKLSSTANIAPLVILQSVTVDIVSKGLAVVFSQTKAYGELKKCGNIQKTCPFKFHPSAAYFGLSTGQNNSMAEIKSFLATIKELLPQTMQQAGCLKNAQVSNDNNTQFFADVYRSVHETVFDEGTKSKITDFIKKTNANAAVKEIFLGEEIEGAKWDAANKTVIDAITKLNIIGNIEVEAQEEKKTGEE